jgi:hypothetical protein
MVRAANGIRSCGRWQRAKSWISLSESRVKEAREVELTAPTAFISTDVADARLKS